MSHLRYEMTAGIEPFLPAKKPPTTPKPSTPIAKPIPKSNPRPRGITAMIRWILQLLQSLAAKIREEKKNVKTTVH